MTALVLLVTGCVLVLWPFAAAVVWALIIAVATWPIIERLNDVLGNRRTMAAGIGTFGLVILFVGPLTVIGFELVDSANAAVATIRATILNPPPPPVWLEGLPFIGAQALTFWNEVYAGAFEFEEALRPFAGRISNWAVTAVTGLGADLFQIVMSLLIVFFLYRDGPIARQRLDRFIRRVIGERGEHLLQEAHGTTIGVLYGVLGTAIVQAVLTGLGLWVAGVPGALFLSLLAVVLSVVPMGIGLVIWPSSIWLLMNGDAFAGIALFIWGVFPVGTIDNFLRPFFISTGTQLPFVLILLGIIGGALAMGLLGVFLGPVFLAVAYTLLREWTALQTSGERGSGDAEPPSPPVA